MNVDYMKGVIVPILTPIDENEKIDEAKLRKEGKDRGSKCGADCAPGGCESFLRLKQAAEKHGNKKFQDQSQRLSPRHILTHLFSSFCPIHQMS